MIIWEVNNFPIIAVNLLYEWILCLTKTARESPTLAQEILGYYIRSVKRVVPLRHTSKRFVLKSISCNLL